jgi:hypothetical protein
VLSAQEIKRPTFLQETTNVSCFVLFQFATIPHKSATRGQSVHSEEEEKKKKIYG